MSEDKKNKYAEFEFSARRGQLPTQPKMTSNHLDKGSNFHAEMNENLPGSVNQSAESDPGVTSSFGEFFPQGVIRKDLLITLNSSKLLTELICAVIKGPGGAADHDVLDRLIGEAHRLSDGWGQQIVAPEKSVPPYLKANLMKQACRYLAYQWQRQGQIDADRLLALGSEVFSHQVASIDQSVIDLIDKAPDTPPTSSEEARQQIQATCSKAYWNISSVVCGLSARDYGLAGLVDDAEDRFLYGKKPDEIVSDLLEQVISIADANRIETSSRDLSVAWYRNAINRLTNLIGSNYQAITKMILNDIDANAPTAATQVRSHFQLYDSVLSRVMDMSAKQFVNAEKVAVNLMNSSKFIQAVDAEPGKQLNDSDNSDLSLSQNFMAESPGVFTFNSSDQSHCLNSARQSVNVIDHEKKCEPPKSSPFKYSF